LNSKRVGDPEAETALSKAWRQASEDLAFEFISPFSFEDKAGKTRTCAGLVRHFGGPMGALIIGEDSEPDTEDAGAKAGYYTSALSPLHYNRYNPSLFMNTLRDWGWHGPTEKKPSWFYPH
jgi:hypothetical protein